MEKEAIAILLDVNMAEDALEQAKDVIKQMLHQKILDAKKTDLTSILYLNHPTLPDKNHLDYEAVHVAFPLQTTSVEMLEHVNETQKGKDKEGDVFDGMVVAGDVLIHQKGKYDKRLYVFTNTALPNAEEEYLQQLSTKFTSESITLYIITPEVISDEPNISKAQMMTVEEVQEVLSEGVAVKRTRQTAVFKGNLMLGSVLSIGVKAYTKVQAMPLARFSRLASAERSLSYVTRTKTEDAKAADDSESERFVEKEKLIKAFRYGKSLVPFHRVDLKAAALESEKGLCILGFGKLGELQTTHLLGNALMITADEDAPNADPLMSALVRAMWEKDAVAVARYVRANGQAPKLLALVPKVRTGGREALYAVQLPFADDVRRFVFPRLPVRVSEKQKAAMAQFIQDNTKDEVDTGNNPVQARILHAIQLRALNPSSELPAVNVRLLAMITPQSTNLPESFATLVDLFPLKSAERWQAVGIDQVMPRFWSSTSKDEKNEKHLDDAEGEFNHDVFWKWMNDRMQDRVAEAMVKMMSHIPKVLIKQDVQEAMRCLKALREGAVREEEHIRFNAYMSEIKRHAGSGGDEEQSKLQALWERMREEALGPISNAECENSSMTPEQAGAYFAV